MQHPNSTISKTSERCFYKNLEIWIFFSQTKTELLLWVKNKKEKSWISIIRFLKTQAQETY